MKKKVVAVLQARMGSSRLPGKSMMEIAGKPLVWHVLNRVIRSKEPDEFILATTTKPEDDALVKLAGEFKKVKVFRGSENDLVDRYYRAAKESGADVVVRLPADNACFEPSEIDRIIKYHIKSGNDFSSNIQNIDNNGYPDGIGGEVMSFTTLEKLWKTTTEPRHREHVTNYIFENRDKFKIGTISCPAEFRRPDIKLDVNTHEELDFIKALYEYLYPKNKNFHITDIIKWYDDIYMKDRRSKNNR